MKGKQSSSPFLFAHYEVRDNGLRSNGTGQVMQTAYKVFVAATLAFWPASGFGITLTNRDSTDQKLVIIEGDKQSERTIKAGEKLELCPKSCVIRLTDGEDYEFDGQEIVSLEEGLLFLDDPGGQPPDAR